MGNKAVSNRVLILILAVLLLLSGAALILGHTNAPDDAAVEIIINGKLAEHIPLGDISAAYSYIVTTDWGGNTLLIEPDGVSVIAADCPDKLCVQRGKINGVLLPIVCLPHRLAVRVTGGAEPEFDAVSGL